MDTLFETLGKLRLFPIIVIDRAEDARPLGEALMQGGLPIAEVTFRTAAAEDAIRRIAQIPNMLVGAGTVLTVEQVKRAVGAGATFIVSPGTDADVVRYCLESNIPVTPGVCTPSDIQAALRLGASVLKFFPAEAFGGVATLQALSAPFPGVKFIPTGGIDAHNLADYLKLQCVLACAGSWMVNRQLIKDGAFARIAELVREAVAQAGSTGK